MIPANYNLWHFSIRLSPVSYTHLDVYKRQVKVMAEGELVAAALLDGVVERAAAHL